VSQIRSKIVITATNKTQTAKQKTLSKTTEFKVAQKLRIGLYRILFQRSKKKFRTVMQLLLKVQKIFKIIRQSLLKDK
jgi:hypothetical protein